MDENKEIDASSESVETTAAIETGAREECEKSSPSPQQVRRKNGRNCGRQRSSAKLENQASSTACGEIEDMSSFSEKISGSNVNGYGDSNPYENSEASDDGRKFDRNPRRRRDDRGEKGDRKRFERKDVSENSNDSEALEASDETSSETALEEERKGPMFEVSNSTSGIAIETPLVDRRERGKNSFKNKDSGVVSYSPELPKKGVLARIKAMLSSVFGGRAKKSNSKNSFKNNKNWKNEKGGKKFNNRQGNRHNNRSRNGGAGNGGGKKRYHSNNPRRRGSGGAPRSGDAQ